MNDKIFILIDRALRNSGFYLKRENAQTQSIVSTKATGRIGLISIINGDTLWDIHRAKCDDHYMCPLSDPQLMTKITESLNEQSVH